MTKRPNPYQIAPDLMKPLIAFGTAAAQSGLETDLIHLVEIRASQINGCAVCLQMHSQAARRHGESEERIVMLDAWRESTLYSERERAALAWTEALTRLPDTRAPDEVYAVLREQFDPEEQVKLTLMVVAINGFNRIGVGFKLGDEVARAMGVA